MGITERHWFEDEEPELTDRQLEDAISIQDRVYRRGYYKGYSDGTKEVFRLQTLLKEREERIKLLEHRLETLTKWRMNAGAFD